MEKPIIYANQYSHTDITPFEIIRVVSDKTLEIREMQTKIDNSVQLDFHVGGYSAHCSNSRNQMWFISPDETAVIIKIHLGKTGWKDEHGRNFKLETKPVMFYDYNF